MRQRGFTMLEIIIGLALLGVALLGFARLQAQQTEAAQARTQGEALASVQAIFAQYFLVNRSEIMSAMGASAANDANVQKHCVIKVTNLTAAINPGATPGAAGPNGTLAWSGGAGINDGLKTCAFDLTLLQARGLWPTGLVVTFQNPDTGGVARWVAIVKRVRGPGADGILGNADDALTEDAEMVVAQMDEDGSLGAIAAGAWRQNPSLQTRVLGQADVLGQSGGHIPVGNTGACSAINNASPNSVRACGPGWSQDLQRWIDTTQFNTLRSALPAS